MPSVMSGDSVVAYESVATEFQRQRDKSTIGIETTQRWARSLDVGSKTLEIACGGGFPVTRILVDAGLEVHAIDASPTLVRTFASRFPGIPVRCEAVQRSDFFGETYDAAICIGLLFLLDEADQLAMLERVAAVLRPGARFLFTAPLETGSWIDRNTGHGCVSLGQRVYEPALSQSGFRVAAHHQDSGANHYYEAERKA